MRRPYLSRGSGSDAVCVVDFFSYDVPEIHRPFADYLIIPVQSVSGMRARKREMTRVINREVLSTHRVLPETQETAPTKPQQIRPV